MSTRACSPGAELGAPGSRSCRPQGVGEAETAVSQTGGSGGSGTSLTSRRDASRVTFKTLQRRWNRAARRSPDTLQQPVLALLAMASAGKRDGDC